MAALGGAGPNWEQFRSAQVPSQLVPKGLYLYVFDEPRVDYTLAWGPLMRGALIGSNLSNWLKAGPAHGVILWISNTCNSTISKLS